MVAEFEEIPEESRKKLQGGVFGEVLRSTQVTFFFSFVSTLCVVLLYSRHVLCVLVISVRLLVFHFVVFFVLCRKP